MPTPISSRLLEAAKVFVEAQEKLKEISDSDKTSSRELKAAAAEKAFEDLLTDLAGIKPADIDCDPNLKKLNQLVDNQADRQQLADTIFKQVIGPCFTNKDADNLGGLPPGLLVDFGTAYLDHLFAILVFVLVGHVGYPLYPGVRRGRPLRLGDGLGCG